MSYNGAIDYGLLGDYDALPDIDLIAEGIEASLQELLRGRAGQAGAAPRRPAERRRRNRTEDPTPILPSEPTRALAGTGGGHARQARAGPRRQAGAQATGGIAAAARLGRERAAVVSPPRS